MRRATKQLEKIHTLTSLPMTSRSNTPTPLEGRELLLPIGFLELPMLELMLEYGIWSEDLWRRAGCIGSPKCQNAGQVEVGSGIARCGGLRSRKRCPLDADSSHDPKLLVFFTGHCREPKSAQRAVSDGQRRRSSGSKLQLLLFTHEGYSLGATASAALRRFCFNFENGTGPRGVCLCATDSPWSRPSSQARAWL